MKALEEKTLDFLFFYFFLTSRLTGSKMETIKVWIFRAAFKTFQGNLSAAHFHLVPAKKIYIYIYFVHLAFAGHIWNFSLNPKASLTLKSRGLDFANGFHAGGEFAASSIDLMVYWSIYLVGCRLADWSIHLSVGYIVERLVDWWVDWKIGLLVVTEYVNLIPSTNQPMNELTYWSISWAAFWITAETFHFFFLFKSSFWMTANVQRTSKDRLVQATQYSRHPRHPPFPLTDTLSRNVEFTSLLLFFFKVVLLPSIRMFAVFKLSTE